MVCRAMLDSVVDAWLLYNLYPFHMDTLTRIDSGLNLG